MDFNCKLNFLPTFDNISYLIKNYGYIVTEDDICGLVEKGYLNIVFDLIKYEASNICTDYIISDITILHLKGTDIFKDFTYVCRVIDDLLNLGVPIETNSSLLYYVYDDYYIYEGDNNHMMETIDYLILKGADIQLAIKEINNDNNYINNSKFIEYLENIERVETKAIEN